MNSFTSLANHFLIAMPNLVDPFFFQTVTYICEHNQEGALGIIINRPLPMTMGGVFEQMNLPTTTSTLELVPVFGGGPVQQERGFVLHGLPSRWESSIQVSEQLFLTTSMDVIEALARDEGPSQSLVALGYAGWGAGQLEKEIGENAWLSGPADTKILFEMPSESRWKAAAESIGIDLQLLSNQPGHA